jgi:hypothetical protein
MSEMHIEAQRVAAPKVTLVKIPWRKPDAPLVATITTAAPAVEIPEAPPSRTDPAATADTGAPVAPGADAAQHVVPAAEPPPAAIRRATAVPVTVPWDSDLPGISSADIRAELARRQRRVPKLLAERAQVIHQMEAIEDALEAMGE